MRMCYACSQELQFRTVALFVVDDFAWLRDLKRMGSRWTLGRRWEHSVVNLNETCCEIKDWIHLAECRVQ
jgi:hypothetical protein